METLAVQDPSNGGSTIEAARDYESGRTLTQTQGGGKYPDGPPLAKLHDGEPWFFLRAQDELAPDVVEFYADKLERYGLIGQGREVRRFALRMREWQTENPDKVKLPD